MAPRKKPVQPDPAQLDIEQAIAAVEFQPAALIKEHLTLKAYVEGEQKRLSDFLKPSVERMQACKAQLHAKALEQKVNGFPTDEGTAYLSEITNHAIDPESGYTNADGRQSFGRDALLAWMLENWDDYGSEGMLLGITKPIVEKWRDATKSEELPNGVTPPGLKLTTDIRLNIKKS